MHVYIYSRYRVAAALRYGLLLRERDGEGGILRPPPSTRKVASRPLARAVHARAQIYLRVNPPFAFKLAERERERERERCESG